MRARTPHRIGPRRRVGGFTLIELLIAAALLAVLAVLSWRGLGAVLDSRRHIVAASDELRSLTLAFAQLDEDLRRSWPVRLLKLEVPSIAFTVAGEQAVATLEVLRETGATTDATQLQRVAWRLREGVLERGFGAWTAPSSGGFSSSAERSSGGFGAGTGAGTTTTATTSDGAGGLIWQPVLAGVSALQMQGWVQGQGWVAAEALAGQLRGAGTPTPGATAGTGAGGNSGATGTSGTAGAGGTTGGTAGGAGASTPTGGTAVAVTGLIVRVVRSDGRVLQRILPVKD
jgi:general secretion pathway protein J